MIEVYAASVNPVDWEIGEGYLKEMIQYKFALVFGWDVARVVKKTDPHASLFKAGDRDSRQPPLERPEGVCFSQTGLSLLIPLISQLTRCRTALPFP